MKSSFSNEWGNAHDLNKETCVSAQRAGIAVLSSHLVGAVDYMKTVEGFTLRLHELTPLYCSVLEMCDQWLVIMHI